MLLGVLKSKKYMLHNPWQTITPHPVLYRGKIWMDNLQVDYLSRKWHCFCKITTMMTSSNGNILRVTVYSCGEFTGHRWIPRTQRPVTRSFDVFFDLRLNKRLSKQSWGWWLETPSRSLWRHCNAIAFYFHLLGHYLVRVDIAYKVT